MRERAWREPVSLAAGRLCFTSLPNRRRWVASSMTFRRSVPAVRQRQLLRRYRFAGGGVGIARGRRIEEAQHRERLESLADPRDLDETTRAPVREPQGLADGPGSGRQRE